MGIFIKTKPLFPIISESIEEAIKANPKDISNLNNEINTRAVKVIQKVSNSSGFYWTRLIFASIFLFIILIAGIYTDSHNIESWSKTLLHSFELLLGIFIGLLGGEATSKI